MSLAGRDDVVDMRWDLTRGMIESGTLRDCVAVVSQLSTDAILTMVGVQGVLPLST